MQQQLLALLFWGHIQNPDWYSEATSGGGQISTSHTRGGCFNPILLGPQSFYFERLETGTENSQ